MKFDANIGVLLVVAGLFALTFYLLRTSIGPNAIVGAAGCSGLTGATLTACQKAQVKPKPKPKPVVKKPVGITPAPRKATKAITAARPRGITAANPNKVVPREHISSTTGGGVGGPRTSAYNCRIGGGTWKCFNTAKAGRQCVCHDPIKATSPNVALSNACNQAATRFYQNGYKEALLKAGAPCGYTTIDQMWNNTALSCGKHTGLIKRRYESMERDAHKKCTEKYLHSNIDPKLRDQIRNTVPREPGSVGSGFLHAI